MNLFALTCGRKMANCEILTKEALIGAEEMGVNVEMLRLQDLNIEHCKICWPAPCMIRKDNKCVIDDDGYYLREKILECDGMIIAAPVYTLTPPGYLLTIRDRLLGPRMDIASLGQVKKNQGIDDRFEHNMSIDERIFKKRVGGFISVGGAPKRNWVSLGIPLLYTLTFSLQVEIVDQFQVLGVAEDGAIVLEKDRIKRARRLGKNIGKAMKNMQQEVTYMGDDKGTCPVCHQNLMVMGNESYIECAICGIKGYLSIDDGKITVDFPEVERSKSILKYEGKLTHHNEISEVMEKFLSNKHKLPELIEKYQQYESPLIFPPGKSKNSSVS